MPRKNLNDDGSIKAPTGKSGESFRSAQVCATNEGFARVNQDWLSKCKTFEEGIGIVKRDEGDTEDIDARYGTEMIPVVGETGTIAFERNGTDRQYIPTPHALEHLAIRSRSFYSTAQDILGVKKDKDDDQKYTYESNAYDAATYIRHLDRKMNLRDHPEDPFFWRLNNRSGEVRAVFTSNQRTEIRGAAFTAIDNEWLLEILSSIVPNGRLSHWRGNPDTIRTNVLIPDCNMENNGADYGGGIAVRNSEIGELKLSIRPFLFTFICFNGMVHNRENGEDVIRAHRGNINYAELEKTMRKSIAEQLKLIPAGIEELLNTRSMKWDGCTLAPVFYTVANKFKLTYQQASKALEAYDIEVDTNVENKNTLLGIVNSVTRAAQGWDGGWKGFTGGAWDRLSETASNLVSLTPKRFESLIDEAKEAKVKDVDKFFKVGVN